jgi:hypothetical protein
MFRMVRAGRLMREADRQNVGVVKSRLEKRRALTAGILLLYAFSLFPSNYLFIASRARRLQPYAKPRSIVC